MSVLTSSLRRVLACVVLLAVVVSPAAGNVFLAKLDDAAVNNRVNQSSIKQILLEEVHSFMGRGSGDALLPEIQKALEPMWASLPKNSYGNLGSDQVRYAMHRLFVQRHGWHIDGLDGVGRGLKQSGSSSPAGLFRERVPAYLMEVFEESFGHSGLKLHEVTMFAATLEHIIHGEATSRLHDVYEALEIPLDAQLGEEELQVTMDVYMMSLLLGQNRLRTPGTIQEKLAKLGRAYPGWADTQLWLRDLRETVAFREQPRANPFVQKAGLGFGEVERVVEQVSQQFGNFQNGECQHLKDTLLESEEGNSGRVLLSDFYKKGLETKALFKESVDYLREQGALDESKPGEPRVIVPNFIQSPGNCLADTGFYSVCCINECESLLGQIERIVAAPEATPEEIVSIVSRLSSGTVEAPRVLSERLVSQIELVAMRHGGRVPLHSRSLAQWLHVAFPRECPYPHVASAASGKSTSELKASYQKNKMNMDQREQYINEVQQQEKAEGGGSEGEASSLESEEELLAKWSHEEEILYLAGTERSAINRRWTLGSVAKFAFGALAGAGVLAAVADALARGRGAKGRSEKAHLV